MPHALGDLYFGTDGRTAEAIDDLEKVERVSQPTGANIVIVSFILDAKRNTHHLFLLPFHQLESSTERKVSDPLLLPNQQRKVLVSRIARELREDWPFAHHHGLG